MRTHTSQAADRPAAAVIGDDGLDALIRALTEAGRRVLAPTEHAGAITIGDINGLADLPRGRGDVQAPGRYRLTETEDAGWFAHGPTAEGWKRFLYPPEECVWRAEAKGASWREEPTTTDDADSADTLALLGVRACDLAAVAVLDRVLGPEGAADPRYRARRERAVIVAVDCARPGGTCFCASMGTGPGAGDRYDLRLTPLADDPGSRFLVRAGSAAGADLLARLPARPADDAALAAAEATLNAAGQAMGRAMPADAEARLKRNLEHPRWNETAERCLTCGNCTSVCPTCFCSEVEDRSSLDGRRAERWRLWDSCFSVRFSYLHGGSVRESGAARYRQWITHKLAWWHDQFGTSGCVGCGRCITWCPVGIDITEEVAALPATAAAVPA
ncbi:MAG: sulfite reductase subunit A [Rhodospirillales bacterium]|nr:MAG: sulfite reductase subunit A [Rhodospirillales bacterium]